MHQDLFKENITRIDTIQKLWGGYGTLNRVYFSDSKTIIIKQISFPSKSNHPRGWNTEKSHFRKVKSYEVERDWYKYRLGDFTNAKTPNYICSGQFGENIYFIIEDLQQSGYKSFEKINFNQVKLCLKWLASFHTSFLNTPPTDLWKIGTYWNLDTRADELEALEDLELKHKAKEIDLILKEAKYQTIVHGDAKLSNFLFTDNQVAAVDFQYPGQGVGVKDLIYFLSSIYNSDELFQNEKKCLDMYFYYLNNEKVEKEWRTLYSVAWCDFYRFLKGWSPDHWKIHEYSLSMRDKVLKCL